jgi:hypothetical protein
VLNIMVNNWFITWLIAVDVTETTPFGAPRRPGVIRRLTAEPVGVGVHAAISRQARRQTLQTMTVERLRRWRSAGW